jgi:hypothetical protein
MTKGVSMDDQNQANNQFPKKPEADVTSSAPVEAEPATDSSATPMPPVSAPQTPAQPSAPAPGVSQPSPVQPQPSAMPTAPLEEEKKLEMPPQPGLLEAPKKNNSMLIVGIAVVLVIVLAVAGYFVYKAMY